MYRKFLSAVFVAAIAFVACLKEEEIEKKPDNEPVEPPVLTDVVKTVSIPMSFVPSVDPDSKAGLGDFTGEKFPFTWHEGDLIRVLVGEKLLTNRATVSVNAQDPKMGTVSISFAEDEIPTETSGEITLLYPGTTLETNFHNGDVEFILPTSQFAGPDGMPYNGYGKYNEGMGTQLLPCIAYAGNALDVYNGTAEDIKFSNPFALVSFKLDGTLSDVKRVVFDTMHKTLGSTFTISHDTTVEWIGGEYQPYITLYAGKPDGEGNVASEDVFEVGKTYHFLVPATKLQNGFVITLYKADGQTLARGAKNPYKELLRSSVNDLGVFTASDFSSDAGFTKINYPFATEKARLAIVGSFVVIANGGTILKFYDRITGEWRRDMDVSTIGVYGNPNINMLAADDAGNIVFGASVPNDNTYANIYYLTSSITTVQVLGSYVSNSQVANCSGLGNLRVSGDVTKNAVITMFTNGNEPKCVAYNVVNGSLGTPYYKSLPSASSTIWNWGNGVVCPVGENLDQGLFYIAYNGRYHLESAESFSSDFVVQSSYENPEYGWMDNPNSMDIAMVNGNRYLAVGVGAHYGVGEQNAPTVPRVVVYDVYDECSVINRWTLPTTVSTGAGAWSDVQIVPSFDGDYHLYYLSTNNGYFACRKFSPGVDPGEAPTPESALKAPKIIAHRGTHNEPDIPENSIASFAKSQEIKCYGSEVDVWITADDQIVCYHDASLTIGGVEYSIKNSTYDQIKDYTLTNGEKLPKFEAMLDQLAKSSDTKMILEFKHHWDNVREQLAVNKAIEMIKSKGLSHLVDYIAFNYETCKLAAQLMPSAEVSYLAYDANTPEPDATLKNDGIDCIDYSYVLFENNPKWISKAHSLNMDVNIWTLNTEAEFLKWIRQGVDYITTDEPELLQQVISQYCAQ